MRDDQRRDQTAPATRTVEWPAWEKCPLDVHELRQAKTAHLLIDCRTTQEHDMARIEGARLVPMDRMADQIDEICSYADGPVIVHCHTGRRSLMVARALRRAGARDVWSMCGGIDRWSLEIDAQIPRY